MEAFYNLVPRATAVDDFEVGPQDIASTTTTLPEDQNVQDDQQLVAISNNQVIDTLDEFTERFRCDLGFPDSYSISSCPSDGCLIDDASASENLLNAASQRPKIGEVPAPIPVFRVLEEELLWNSIWNLNDCHQLQKLLLFKNPTLMAMKIVQCQDSFINLLQSISVETAVCLFHVLEIILSSAFEFHKSIVFNHLVSVAFLERLKAMLAEDTMSAASARVLAHGLSKVYTDIYSNSDTLIAESSTKLFKLVVSEFKCRLAGGGLIEDQKLMVKLLSTANSHNGRIKRGSLYPFTVFNSVNVEPNKIKGRYSSFQHYTRVQLDLLKEDFSGNVRSGILKYLKGPKPTEPVTIQSTSELNVFPGVTLSSFICKSGRKHCITFSNPETIAFLNRKTQSSTIFRNGSLVFLTSVETPFEGNRYMLARVMHYTQLRHCFVLYVSLIGSDLGLKAASNLLLIEPTQLFEPYYRVMSVLRSIGKIDYPFVRQIVELDTESRLPSYLRLDSSVTINGTTVHVNEDSQWPEPESLGLNSTQMDGLKHVLRNELAIVQGPPGTGKTYMSKKIIQILLDNKALWCKKNDDCGVIIVVAASNHSVDDLLSGLLFMGMNVLRIGSRGTSPIMSEYNLSKLRKYENAAIFSDLYKTLLQKQSLLVSDLSKSTTIVESIDDNAGLIQYHLLKPFMALSSKNLNHLRENYERFFLPSLTNAVRPVIERLAKKDPVYLLKTEDIQREIEVMEIGSPGYDLITLRGLADAATFLKEKLSVPNDRDPELLKRVASFCTGETMIIENLSLEDRWHLYMLWKKELRALHCDRVKELNSQLNHIYREKEELLCFKDALSIVQSNAEVVGMTSTAAARLHNMMEYLKPKIVLVEEAAHMHEPHTVASLTRYCEHLILVGDHQQLRPAAATLDSRKVNKFGYSLFERLIENGIRHSTLTTQFRMRPEIAALIAPSVYSHLTNDSSVEMRDHIKGVAADVFFFDHCYSESKESTSLHNVQEAELCALFCLYLLLQGYDHSQITILAAYEEQKKAIRQCIQPCTLTSKVNVETVDSYQGHENDIILVSTVRSNDAGVIGFLGDISRVTVALSRAKIGLYIFGNATTLLGKRKSGIWHKVIGKLHETKSIGKSLPLRCQFHGTIVKMKDTEMLSQIIQLGTQTFCEQCLSG